MNRRSLKLFFCFGIVFLFSCSILAVEKNKKNSDSKIKNKLPAVVLKPKLKSKKKSDQKQQIEEKKQVDEPSAQKVKKFEFVGIKRTPEEELKKISSKYIQSSLYGDWTQKMSQEIQALPIVREVSLIRGMTGNITFQITEREPIAYLFLGKYYWMDERATVIQEADNKNLEDKIFFSGPWNSLEDYKKKNGSVLMMEGVRFYSQLLSAGFEEKKISGIHFDANLGWIMYRVGSHAPVVFGIKNLPEKIGRFVQVVPEIATKEMLISRIDADFNDRIVVKFDKDKLENGSVE